jgi:hypothetical protein
LLLKLVKEKAPSQRSVVQRDLLILIGFKPMAMRAGGADLKLAEGTRGLGALDFEIYLVMLDER